MEFYIILVFFLSLYGLRCVLACLRLMRARKGKVKQDFEPPIWPRVLIQLPLYNERNSVAGLLESIRNLDYPDFTVQILDDSNDETTQRIQKILQEMPSDRFRHIRRENRQGYKAGALQYGLTLEPEIQYAAIFDADFRPKPDFLKPLVGRLMQSENLALVQARWNYLNTDTLLTRLQSLGMDGHFAVEQPSRAWAGLFMNFNGTAGVWRTSWIKKAGGWSDRTLTEDLDLSYRVQMLGGQMDYLLEVDCPGELPEEIRAFKAQQARWAKGSIQTACLILPDLLRQKLPMKIKLEAFFHLTHYLVHPLILCCFLGSLLCYAEIADFFKANPVAIFPLLFLGAGPTILYFYSQKLLNKKRKIRDYFLILVLGCSLSVSNGIAALSGIIKKGGEFKRTPKTGDGSQPYFLKGDRTWFWELLIGLAGLIQLLRLQESFWPNPVFVLCTAGYLLLGLASLNEQKTLIFWRKTVTIVLCLLLGYPYL